MSRVRICAVAILLWTVSMAGLAHWMRPTDRLTDHQAKIDLETMFPKQFGGWQIDTHLPVAIVSPDVQAQLDAIYNQVLSRTYVDERGERIMVSVAYGGDQSDATRAHRPDVCYPAQGFDLLSSSHGTIVLPGSPLPVQRLVAKLGPRVEPITFWFTVGNYVAVSAKDQKIAQLRYGLRGIISDGMLVRISSISNDTTEAFSLQERFVRDLYASFDKRLAPRVFGEVENKS